MRNNRPLLALLTGLSLALLGGCGVSTINVAGDYPSPLVSKLPLTVGVYYGDDFRNYRFTEITDATGKDQLIINSGASQVALFDTVLPAVFENVVHLENLESVSQHDNLDAVFVPVIQEFQVGLPDKTKLNVFEIWIKYNMRLSEADGDYIADWVMTAYGKSPTETFRSTDDGVNNATVVALRDLAASFALGFTRIPEVNEWLRERSLVDAAQ